MVSEAQYLRAKRYRQNHAEQLDAYHKKWVEEHREHVNAYNREYRLKRKRESLGWNRWWRKTDGDGDGNCQHHL